MYGILGLRQINTCRKVPLHFNFLFFFRMTTFCLAFYESYLSTCLPKDTRTRNRPVAMILVRFLFRTFGMADTYYSWFLVTELHVWMLGVRTQLNNNILFLHGSVLAFP